MMTMGLSVRERRAWQQQLAVTHAAPILMHVLDTDGGLRAAIRPTLDSGQINLDINAAVTRSATLSFTDDSRSLQFDSDCPNPTALYFDRMIQLFHVMYVPAIDQLVHAPMFTGPLVKFDRTGDTVNVECQGKEALGLQGVSTMTIPRGSNAINTIRRIMNDRVGEVDFGFPTTSHRLPKAVTVSWEEKTWPWTVCKRIASSIGLHLYYDPRGTCRIRDYPSTPCFEFHAGENGNITSMVQMSHDLSTVRNRVHVTGSKPAHSDDAVLPDKHPLSSYSLRINGVRRFFSEEISAPKIGSKAAARARARLELKPYSAMEFGTTFNALTVPHLDERDLIRVETDEYHGVDRLQQFSLALTGGEMTIGFTDRLALPMRKHKK